MVIKRFKKNKTYFTNDFYSGIWQVVVEPKKVIFCCVLAASLRSGSLAVGHRIHLDNNFFSILSLFESIFLGIVWIGKLHDCK